MTSVVLGCKVHTDRLTRCVGPRGSLQTHAAHTCIMTGAWHITHTVSTHACVYSLNVQAVYIQMYLLSITSTSTPTHTHTHSDIMARPSCVLCSRLSRDTSVSCCSCRLQAQPISPDRICSNRKSVCWSALPPVLLQHWQTFFFACNQGKKKRPSPAITYSKFLIQAGDI